MSQPILALTASQVRATLRDRSNLILAAVFALISGATIPLFGDTLLQEVTEQITSGRSDDDEEKPRRQGTPRVAVVGDPPAWMDPDALGALTTESAADVIVRVHGDAPVTVDVVALRGSAGPVLEAAREQLDEERDARLDDAGISERPGRVTRARFEEAKDYQEPRESRVFSALGVVLLFMGAFLMNPVLEALPRARTSGWLETLAVTPMRRSDVVLATWLTACLTGALLMALTLTGFSAAGLYEGQLPGELGFPLLALPALVSTLAAFTLALMCPAVDVRSAYLRSFWWIPVVSGAALGAAALDGPWGGLVPLGGVVAVVVGLLPGDAATLSAAWLSALVTTGGLLTWTGRLLERADLTETTGARTARRRASGDWRPEVLLLFLLAVSGLVCWQVMLPTKSLAAGAAVGLIGFVLMPALAVGPALGLPARPLLRLRRPSLRSLLLIPGLVAGTQAAGLLGHLLQQALMPSSAATLESYGEGFGELSGGLGLAVVTIGPGVCEELLFRGAILSLLLKRGSVAGAVVGQAALFAALHIYGFKLLPTFSIGLMLGLYALRSRSIWPVMIAHALHNLVAVRGTPLLPPGWLESPAGLATLGVMALVGLGACRLTSPPAEAPTPPPRP